MKKSVHSSTGTSSAKQRSLSSVTDKDQDVNSIFKRTEVIGRGKFGIVYKGYNVKTKKIYAIKVLNLDSDDDEVDDVQREIQFLASLKQLPNITRYYGSYLKNTSLWIIMEYCAGGSLRSLLRPGKIDEKYIGVIMRELLIALKYIHKDNIIHRDIKAANVLVTNDGSIKLCDFGVAAQLNHATLRRQTMAGTPYWMAPEVIMEGVYYDTKVDIWSLGITAYEIATGNPPYCEVEALRAMQLITKSKPPRLEGRSYSPLLKEFIALCLDEDPSERLSADDLLKTKFIKSHKPIPTSVLKELISRYLLFRDKSRRESISSSVEEKNINQESNSKENSSNNEPTGSTSISSEQDDIDMKWDFDSLSSTDYIMANNINVDAIPEESNDWAGDSHEHFNYAYPDEDHIYFQTNNNGKTYFQGATIGKGQPGTIYHNSTLNAPLTHLNTTGNYNSKAFVGTSTNMNSKGATGTGTYTAMATGITTGKGTGIGTGLGTGMGTGPDTGVGTSIGTGTYQTNMASSRKVETKAPKQLLELFEENDINELDENERLSKNKPSQLGALPEDMTSSSDIKGSNSSRPHTNMINENSFISQNAPSMPVIQTMFSSSSMGPSSAVTTVPTSVEIEIPEELPTSSVPAATSTDSNYLHTKPRSSTVSISPLSYKQQAPPQLNISRRLTVGSGSNRSNDNGNTNPNTIADEISRSVSNGGNVTQNKMHRKTPSPSKIMLSAVTSPNRNPVLSPTGVVNTGSSNSVPQVNSLGAPPTMKPMTSSNDGKDLLLHPLNSTSSTINMNASAASSTSSVATSSGSVNTNPTPISNLAIAGSQTTSQNNNNNNNTQSNEKETSRINGDFKRNNPNLKLQMPLPTSVGRNKLLENNNVSGGHTPFSSNASNTNIANMTNENINQFGFNTSTVQNMPVSMTPISEKHMDFGSKLKKSHSISKRKNSLSASTSATEGANNSTSGNTVVAATTTTSTASHNSEGNGYVSDNGTTTLQSVPFPKEEANHIGNINSPHQEHIMQRPPSALKMDMFLDTENWPTAGKSSRIDRKPQVLEELQTLLQMFEESLPVIEDALKAQLDFTATTQAPNANSTTTLPATTASNTASTTAIQDDTPMI